MHKRYAFSLACLSFALLAATQDTQIRVEVEAVNVLVTILDDDGRFVTDLNQDQFLIYEDGKLQEITNFARRVDLPLRIGLLIDTSSSVRMKLDFEKEAAINFIRSVMRYRDRALLVEFDEGVSLLHDFTGRPTAIIEKIRELRAGGGTALLDAVFTVSLEKMTMEGVRKTLIVVSDGQDLNSKRNLAETVMAAQTSDVTIYTIGTSRFGASGSKRGEDLLKRFAQETGGRAFFPYSARLMEDSFDQINEELRSQYSLTYVPKNKDWDGRFRKIEVRVEGGKGYTLHYKKGYYTPNSKS
jgi:VWFA-related protein